MPWYFCPCQRYAWPDPTTHQEPLRGRTDAGQASATPEATVQRLKAVAQINGVGDSISTYLALQNSLLHERNPLVNTSAGGLVALAATKVLMMEVFDANLSTSEKEVLFPLASAMYASATASNLLLAASALNPVAVAGGIAAGVYTYQTQTVQPWQASLKFYCSEDSRLRNCSKDIPLNMSSIFGNLC